MSEPTTRQINYQKMKFLEDLFASVKYRLMRTNFDIDGHLIFEIATDKLPSGDRAFALTTTKTNHPFYKRPNSTTTLVKEHVKHVYTNRPSEE